VGADQLAGGGGADMFLYQSKLDTTLASMDVVQDFAAGDRLEFAGMAGSPFKARHTAIRGR